MVTFTSFSGQADSLVQSLVGTNANFSYIAGSAFYVGDPTAASTFTDLDLGGETMAAGALLTSGTGIPPTTNTLSNFGTDLNLAGDAELSAIVANVFGGSATTFDASSLNFQVNVTNPSTKSLTVDVMFGSDEYPEFSNSFVDIAAVSVNGRNYAFFAGDPTRPLSVLDKNLIFFRDNTGNTLPIEYDGISHKLTILLPVDFGINNIKIAVADTGDHIYDSGIFVSHIDTSEFAFGGIKIKIDAGADIDLPNFLSGGDQDEFIVCGGGNDTAFGGGGDDAIDGGTGNDTAHGGTGNDDMLGGDGNDSMYGDAGNDTLVAGSGRGNDLYNGGAGNDLISFQSSSRGTTVNLYKFFAKGSQTGIDKIVAVENVAGGTGNDDITGNTVANSLAGGNGNDKLNGYNGRDTLTGGLGKDIFVFSTPLKSANRDVITDFNHKSDTFYLDNAVMPELGLGFVHKLDPSFFYVGAKAHDADDHVIYNKKNGALFYDSDGTGGHAQVLLAVLLTKPLVAANDFVVI